MVIQLIVLLEGCRGPESEPLAFGFTCHLDL